LKQAEKQRTISYLRAAWPANDYAGTLQEALEACLQSVPDTQLDLRDGRAEVRHQRSGTPPSRLFLHVAAWTHGEAMSTVPHGRDSGDLDAQEPGDDFDFLDGDGMFLISRNDCLLTPSGLHPKTMEQYLRNLLSKGGGPFERARMFQLLPIADPQILPILRAEGIKAVDLNFGQYMATATAPEARPETLIERLGLDVVLNLFTREEDRRRLAEAENVSAKLVVKLDARKKGLTPEEFSPMAQEIAENSPDDAVELLTNTGQRIRRGALVLRRPVRLRASAKTVSHNHAWEEMGSYLDALVSSGAIEQ